MAPPEAAPRAARLHVWNSVPRLNSGVASPGGDNLEITVTGRQRFCRALVDGEVAKLSDVMFKSGTAEFNGVRSFTFVSSPQ